MKVVILTEGGKEIGFGHITRCLALYQALKKENASPELIINGDRSILGFLRNKNYHTVNWIRQKSKLLEIIDGADGIIIDSYLAPRSLYDKISLVLSGKLIMIDDFNRLEYPKGIVVNPSIYGDKLKYLKRQGVTYLLGKDYIILRKEFWYIPKKKINKKVKDILITFGGVNHSELAINIANYLKKKLDLNFYILEARKYKLTAKEMLNLMLKVDICISGGGQTTYELARVGVPTIGICFAGNQRFNLDGWQEKGFIEYIGWYKDKNLLEKMVLAINKSIPFEERVRRSGIGRNFVDGKGVIRIIGELIKKSE